MRRLLVVNADSASFTEFYERTRDDCLRAVVASVGDRQAAEDLVAEAYARAWTRWHSVSGHPAPQAWVVRTALNTRITWWRRRRHEVPLGDSSLPPATDGALGSVVDRELIGALRRLPARQRQVIALRLFLDLDTAATADTLGIAPETVTAHLARAVMARGRSIQRLRRSRAAAGALAVAITAGLGVPALTAGSSASHPGGSVALTAGLHALVETRACPQGGHLREQRAAHLEVLRTAALAHRDLQDLPRPAPH